MATSFIRVPMTGSAPEDYLVSGAADIDLLSCAAHFDGSGAGSDFLPAIQILDEAGQVAATVVGSKVTAGDSADVTFAPFLEAPAAATPVGSGIQFDVDNVGDWLDVRTTGADADGWGIQFGTSGSNGIWFHPTNEFKVEGQNTVVNATGGITFNGGLGVGTFEADMNVVGIDGKTSALIESSVGTLTLVGNNQIQLTSNNNHIEIDAATDLLTSTQFGGVDFNMGTSGFSTPAFRVLLNGDPVLIIDTSTTPPTYLAKAGASWQFVLP